MIDLLTDQAREKAGMPPEWDAFRWACMPPGHPETLYYEVEGIVPSGVFKSGPRKGRPKFRNGDKATQRTVIISVAEHDQFVADWERRTGKCSACKGDGRELAKFSKSRGKEYRVCRRCKGRGTMAEQCE